MEFEKQDSKQVERFEGLDGPLIYQRMSTNDLALPFSF